MIYSPSRLRARSTAKLLAVAIACFTLGPVACAPVEADEEQATSEAAIHGGQVDTTHRFVVGITMAGSLFDDVKGICSGTLIAPNTILTARHCIAPKVNAETCRNSFKDAISPSRVTVTTDAEAPGTIRYRVSHVFVPEGDETCGDDVAILVLSTNVPSTDAIPAVPVLRERSRESIAAIGYGRTSKTADSSSGTRRIKRGVSMRSGSCTVGGADAFCEMGEREFSTGGAACQGDSGGPAIVDATLDSTTTYVRGVAVRALHDTDGACVEGYYTRTERHAGWIKGVVQWAARSAGYEAPSWAR